MIIIPEIPSPAPNHRKKLDLHRQPEKGTAKFHGSKSWRNRSAYLGPARCAYRGQRRSRTWQSHCAAPQASPLVYTAREKDPRQVLKCLRCGSSRLGLLGVESPGDPACTSRLPAAVGQRFAEGWLGSLCPPPAPLRGCRLAAPPVPLTPPGVGVPFLAPAVTPLWATHPQPAPGWQRGGWGVGVAAVPSWAGGRKAEGGAAVPLLGSRSGGGGQDPLPVTPPSASLAALWHFCRRWAPSAGPSSDARFLPLPGPDRLSRSWATGDGASGASWSPGSRGHYSQPCMPLAAQTRSAHNSLRMPGRVTYDPRPVGAPAALGWPVCPYRQQLATPWPVAGQRSHDGTPCVGQSPPVDPCPLPGPH